MSAPGHRGSGGPLSLVSPDGVASLNAKTPMVAPSPSPVPSGAGDIAEAPALSPDDAKLLAIVEAVTTLEDRLEADHPLRLACQGGGDPDGLNVQDTTDAIVLVMNRHRSKPQLALACIKAVCRLTAVYGEGPHAVARRRLGEHGACEAVVRVFAAHSSDTEVVRSCLEAIKYLGRETSNCRRLGTEGACDLVLGALRDRPRDRDIQYWGCGAVFNLASNVRENKRRMAELGICPLLVTALRTFASDAEIQENGCGAIGNVGDCPGNGDLLRLAGAYEVVVDALRRFPVHRGVNLRGVWALDSLARDPAADKEALGRLGACEVSAAALAHFREDRDMHYWGLGAVKSVAMGHAGNRARFGEAGMCATVLAALSQFRGDVQVVRQSLDVVRVLAEKDNPNKDRFWAAGAPAILDGLRGIARADATAARNAI